MEKKIWYATVLDDADNDWGTGSLDLAKAEEIVAYFKSCGWTDARIVRIDLSGEKPVEMAD